MCKERGNRSKIHWIGETRGDLERIVAKSRMTNFEQPEGIEVKREEIGRQGEEENLSNLEKRR